MRGQPPEEPKPRVVRTWQMETCHRRTAPAAANRRENTIDLRDCLRTRVPPGAQSDCQRRGDHPSRLAQEVIVETVKPAGHILRFNHHIAAGTTNGQKATGKG